MNPIFPRKTPNELTLENCEILAAYIARVHGMNTETEVHLKAISDARVAFNSEASGGTEKLEGEKITKLYTAYVYLSKVAAPVTARSLRDSLDDFGETTRRPYFIFPPIPVCRATKFACIQGVWAVAVLLTLVVVQSYWLIGSSLLNAVPKESRTEEQSLVEANQSRKQLQDELTELKQQISDAAPEKRDELEKAYSAKQTQYFDLEMRFRTGIIAQEESDARKMQLGDMLCGWVQWAVPDSWLPTPAKAPQTVAIAPNGAISEQSFSEKARGTIEAERAINFAQRLLDVLQQYALPLLYGWLGAMAFALRSISRSVSARLYIAEKEMGYRMRVSLGIISGLAIGWFFKPEAVNGVTTGAVTTASVSPFALAFVAGYSVDLLFTALDKIVAAFTGEEKEAQKKSLEPDTT